MQSTPDIAQSRHKQRIEAAAAQATNATSDVHAEPGASFEQLMLGPRTLAGLKAAHFRRPSPVQLAAIPRGRLGFDLLVQSKAGTGKTCVFAVLALEALHFNGAAQPFTQTLIVAPTREIAIQIHQVLIQLGAHYAPQLSVALCIGGTQVRDDRAQMNSATCQIVVGTPGRLKQLIELNVLKTHQIELFVLDEADKLMEQQFKAQIDDIFKRLPSDKQMVVTSATYSDELAAFLRQYMRAPKSVRLGRELSLLAVKQLYVYSKVGHSTKKTLELKLDTFSRLLRHLDFQKALVFTNFQARAPLICDHLNSTCDEETLCALGGPVGYICAELSQEKRNLVSAAFRNSAQKVLVTTDISARGIDIRELDLVINFDLPSDHFTYYHRIGRAGRFGQPGTAVSLVSMEPVDLSLFRSKIKTNELTELSLE